MTQSRSREVLTVLLTVLLIGTLLGGCGGSSPEAEPAPSVASTCEQPFTWLDTVRMSGNRIGSQTQAEWNPSCPIRELQSASLTLCLTHQDLGEVGITLKRPDGVVKTLPALGDWSGTGSCPPGAGKAWSLAIAAQDLRLQSYSGPWTVRVEDRLPANNSEGIFYGWSFVLKGLR